MSEIEENFEKAQQELIDRFKVRMKDAAQGVLDSMYCDVSNYATTDAHTNYRNYLRDEFESAIKNEILRDYSYHSWAHSIRMELLKQHPEELQTKIISDLQERVESLEDHMQQLRNRY